MATQQDPETSYFASHPAPASLNANVEAARKFIEFHCSQKRRVVLITSGGTTVPLERQTVRFIDNFSAGTRGSASAEYFLADGYAVIFLHRQSSLLPYARHFSPSFNCFLDLMGEDLDGHVVVLEEYQRRMREILSQYNDAKNHNLLLSIPFTTITEYLWNLREIAEVMSPLGPGALFYLAAAVSDFFVPSDRLAEHKIQSGDTGRPHTSDTEDNIGSGQPQGNKLVIDLDPVPKFLRTLVHEWAPQAVIVSFKLETDPDLLVSKAQKALQRYSHHLVIANLLSTRTKEVVLVTPDMAEIWVRVPEHRRRKSVKEFALGTDEAKQNVSSSGKQEDSKIGASAPIEIESLIVKEVSRVHDSYIK
ncbi:hypothetical protein MMC25_001853 [Agyrium rufum]|nr:hypothetical protein [Agyrium rufum]